MRASRILTVGVLSAVLVAAPAAPALAQVEITTPYPAVVVEAGGSATFALTVSDDSRRRVNLRVTQLPDGWEATLRGGGFIIDGVFTDPDDPPQVDLDVSVPPDVSARTYRVVVTASAGGDSDTLPLGLRVAEAVEGGLTFTSEFPSLRGASTATFNFDLTLENNTGQEGTFSLSGRGPEGWQVEATPAGEQQAATATVAAGGETTISVTVDPPDDAVAGSYPILVQAVGGGQTAEIELQVDITGNFAMVLDTPDQRLNADVTAGEATEFPILVQNTGTAPLLGLSFSATPPSEWTVTFRPEAIEALPPGEQARVTAVITPAGDAVAGDYLLTISASAPETSADLEVRTTVRTSGLWGVVGILLIAAAIAGLAWVFRTYGRR